MREILFRGKRVDGGEWVEGFLVVAENICKPDNDISSFIFETDASYYGFGEFCGVSEVIAETIGQFTGLTDKNGTKIFEGDIIDGLFLHGDRLAAKVTFKDGAFGLEWNRGSVKAFYAFTSICNVGYEIIGNIHDLKGE